MPPRSTPTARQERLGAELYKLREAAGLTARDAARLLGVDPAKVSHIEAGRVGVSEERLRRLASFYSCGDAALIDALAAMTFEQRGQGWWEDYRGILPAPLLDLSEMEHHATCLRSIQITDVPGILQTEDYARKIFEATIPPLPPAELDARVAHRVDRRGVLNGAAPRQFDAIVHETALRVRFAGREAARAQLAHLLEQIENPHIRLQVITFESEVYPGSARAMLYAAGPVPQLDTVQRESAHGITFLDAEAHLNRYRVLFDTVSAAALGEAASRDLIHTIGREL